MRKPGVLSVTSHDHKSTRTSIDLELDLQASQAKLKQLGEDVKRLRLIKHKIQEAKTEGRYKGNQHERKGKYS